MRIWRVSGAVLLLCAFGVDARAQSDPVPRLRISLEGANVWQHRNDVRIPPDTGTEFSIVDLIGSAPTPSVRAEVTVGLTSRQELRFVYAPLRVTGRGTPGAPIAFAGGSFATIPTEAEYQFTSYRATWRYRVYQGRTWTWSLGATAFIRDARIALAQAGEEAEDSDVGFVPLAHLTGEARLSERWRASLEVDGFRRAARPGFRRRGDAGLSPHAALDAVRRLPHHRRRRRRRRGLHVRLAQCRRGEAGGGLLMGRPHAPARGERPRLARSVGA